jgi:hypothetical protein
MRDLRLIILIIIAVIVLAWFASMVSAASEGATVYPPDAPNAQPGKPPSIEIHQGAPAHPEVVYQGETADLTLVEGWYGIVEKYPGGEVVDVSSFTHDIYIDPALFPVGIWYQWSPDGIFSHGNNVAFEVREGKRQVANTSYVTENGTVVVANTTLAPANLPLPAVHVSDYLVTHGDPLTITFNGLSQIWVFKYRENGGMRWLSPVIGDGTVTFSKDDIESLDYGKYDIIIQHLGTNKIADVAFKNYTKTRTNNQIDNILYSPFDPTNTTSVVGWQPWQIKQDILTRIANGMWVEQAGQKYNLFDDTYEIKEMVIEKQIGDIQLLDEYYRNDDPFNASTIHVGGYTPLAKGDRIAIVMDMDRLTTRTFEEANQTAVVDGDEIGDRRQFSVFYPVYYAQLGPGKHFFTAITPDGTQTTVPFDIYDVMSKKGNIEAPNLTTIRFMGGDEVKNPIYVNTTIEVPVPGPVQTVEKIVEKEVIKIVEVVPWYLQFPVILIWVIIIIGALYYLHWRFS